MNQSLGEMLANNNEAVAAARANERLTAAETGEAKMTAAVVKFFEEAKVTFAEAIRAGKSQDALKITVGRGQAHGGDRAEYHSEVRWALGFYKSTPPNESVSKSKFAKHWHDFVEWAASNQLVASWEYDQAGYGDDKPFWYALTVTAEHRK
jgi:hypothetical protein